MNYLTFSNLKYSSNGIWYNFDYTNYKNREISEIKTDSREDCTNSLFLALSGDKFDGHSFINEAIQKGAAALCLEEGKFSLKNIPANIPVLVVDNTLKAYQRIAAFYRTQLTDITIIAITGSNGKTSTKDILYCLLAEKFGKEKVYATKSNTNNFVGVPQNILQLNNNYEYAVIEIGTNSPGEINILASIVKPNISIITSISEAHTEYLHNLKGIAKEKSDIFKHFYSENNIAIIPESAPWKSILLDKIGNNKMYSFGSFNDPKADLKIQYNYSYLKGTNFEFQFSGESDKYTVSWQIPGFHQTLNAGAAAIAAKVVGMTNEKIAESLKNAKISGMRMQIKTYGNFTFINDAYNANPDNTISGLKWLKNIFLYSTSGKEFDFLIIILGDMLELGERALDEHIKILNYACNIKPDTKICTLGTNYNKANKKINLKEKSNLNSFTSMDEILNELNRFKNSKCLVYLKASRGMELEKIEKYFSETV